MATVAGVLGHRPVLTAVFHLLQTMAAHLPPASSQLTLLQKTLEIVTERVECAICKDSYTAPKKVNCSHTHAFCSECLLGVVKNQVGESLRCPYCTQLITLPQEGVSGLPVATNEQYLREIQDTLKDFDCQASLQQACGKVIDNQATLVIQITEFSEKLIAAVKAKKDALINELTTTTQRKLQILGEQHEQIENLQTKLLDCVSATLQNENIQEEELKETCQKIESLKAQCSLLPREQADTRVVYQYNAMKTCQNFGDLYAVPTYPEECTCQFPKLSFLQKESRAHLQTFDKDGQRYDCTHQQISCELKSSDSTSTVSGTVKKTGIGQYELCYTAPRHGYYKMEVKVKGKHIQGSPFRIVAVKDLTTPIRTIGDLIEPWGVAINKRRQIIVAQWGENCISIIGEDEERTSFGSYGKGRGQLSGPRGVLVLEDDSILVADGDNHRIQKLSPQGDFDTEWTTNLQLKFPTGISIHPLNHQLYITDSDNDQVQVLDGSLNYRHATVFGGRGSGNGQLHSPWDISFDSVGNCYVADSENGRVQVFTIDGHYLRQFGEKGEGKGKIGDCTSIAIDSDIVYIADSGNNRVSIFTVDGDFLTSFGRQGSRPGGFNKPYGICIDDNGLVYVSDQYNSRIQVF